MKAGSQFAWVMVRTIGLILVLFAFTRLVAAVSNGYMAYTLRSYTSICIRSDAPIPENKRDTQENRALVRAQGQAQVAATFHGIVFLVSLMSGLYCIRNGKVLHRMLMPPNEEEPPNQTPGA